MISVVGAVVLIGIIVAGWFSYKHYSKEKAVKLQQIERLEGAHIFKMKILGNLLHCRSKTNYKSRLQEELLMDIEMLMICTKQLKEEKLVTEGPHVLTLTMFGTQYAKVYVKQIKEEPKEGE